MPNRRAKIATAVGVVVIALIASVILPIRRNFHYIDPITGSAKSRTTWLGMISFENSEVSPLEKRLKVMHYQWTPTWYCLDIEPITVWGTVIIYEDSVAPPIYRLQKFLGPFVDHSTDAEIRNFADTMRTGTDAEQNAAVNAACDKALAAMEAP